jgi:3,4-dihydroxy 2-butanone 4-phosphate synthase/GTP cyclohydrolase II
MLCSIAEILDELRRGHFVVLVDDEDRENEGDLMLATEFVTPETINFMVSQARGLVCLALPPGQIERLGLPLMVREENNGSPHRTAFTVSIEAASGVSTGISAADRAQTIRVAANPRATASDVIMPGHVFPIRAQSGGVLKRAGHTEASVDLTRLAGLEPAAVICEIMNANGTMARLPDLNTFSQTHKIKISSIEKLIQYRLETETFVQEMAHSEFDSRFGSGFALRVFKNLLDGSEHLVLSKGSLHHDDKPLLVRVHTEAVLSDVFGSMKSLSGETLRRSLAMIDREGRGAILYLRRPQSLEGTKVDEREYGVGAQILRALGVRQIRLITNNPTKRVGIRAFGLEITETLPIQPEPGATL